MAIERVTVPKHAGNAGCFMKTAAKTQGSHLDPLSKLDLVKKHVGQGSDFGEMKITLPIISASRRDSSAEREFWRRRGENPQH